RLEQALVGLARLAREELHQADDAPWAPQREPEGRVQALTTCGGCAREVLVVRGLGDPGRTTGLEQAAREAFTRSVCAPLRERLELRRARARMPRGDAAQAAVDGADLPDRTELPAQGAPDRLERGSVDLDRPFLFGEDLRDVVLDALQAMRVNQNRH